MRYFSLEECNLSAEKVTIPCGRKSISGYICRNESAISKGKLIIFCHGYGPGYIAYSKLIATLCKEGYTVLCYDAIGCAESEGKGIGLFYNGVICAQSAYEFAKADERLNGMPTYFFGHSWGAYSATVASATCKVDGVVAISGFDSSIDCYTTLLRISPKITFKCVTPIIWLIHAIKYGKISTKKASKIIEGDSTKRLFIWGEDDPVVSANNSLAYFAKGEKLIIEGKRHNPYIVDEGEDLLATLNYRLTDGQIIPDEDYLLMCKEDERVLNTIFNFLKQ